MQKKFNPKPGDKIICNNGDELICCSADFLVKDGFDVTTDSNLIYGYQLSKHNLYQYGWTFWNESGVHGDEGWNIREVIPQSSEVTDDKKEEVKEDSLYTVDEVFDAIFETTKHLQIEIPWDYIDDVKEHLSRKDDPQYLEFLRLKAIYG